MEISLERMGETQCSPRAHRSRGDVQNPARRKPCLTRKEWGSGVGSPRAPF
jgi:hypothetical protein